MNRYLLIILLAIAMAGVVVNSEAAPNSDDTNATKTDSPEAMVKAGWKLPVMPYPKQAANNYYRGKIYVEVLTGSDGRVSKETIVRVDKTANLASLRNAVLEWALYHWSGPPYSKATIGIDFQLH